MLMQKHITRRDAVIGSAVGTLSLAGCAASQEPKENEASGSDAVPLRLAIIHTNDTHGYDIKSDESLGMAAVAQLRHDWEEQGYEVLVLDAGDAVQGNVLVGRSKGATAMDFMDAVGYDAMALGNHEFDFGQDAIEGFVQAATFPVLSANTFVEATGERLVEANTILVLSDGTKVGVFGLTTPTTPTSAFPLLVQGLRFLEGEELYACAQEQADNLRAAGCSLVVCLAHLGEDEADAPNRAQDVATHVSGIDLIIDGHDHAEECQTLTNAAGESVLVVEAGCYTHAVGVVTWEDGKLTSTLERSGSYDGQDAAVAALVQQVQDDLDEELGEVIATSSFELDGGRNPGVRTCETNFGDLVTDALFWEAGISADDAPDAVIMQGGGIRASIHAGDITIRDAVNALPFENYLCTLKLSGAQLLEALEAACSQTPEESGSFPQVAGMKIVVDMTVPYEQGELYPGSTTYAPAKPGSRVTIEEVAGAPFDASATYVIATSDYVCVGGGAYYACAEPAQATMKSAGYLLNEALQYYLVDACADGVSDSYAKPQGRLTLKTE